MKHPGIDRGCGGGLPQRCVDGESKTMLLFLLNLLFRWELVQGRKFSHDATQTFLGSRDVESCSHK